MLFESRSYWLAKDAEAAHEHPETYEDASACSAEMRRAAIADGVSQAMFSGIWARLLTEAAVEQPPDVTDAAAFHQWLVEPRAQWAAQVAAKQLNYFQRQKLQAVHGGYSTLQWLEFESSAPDSEEYEFHSYAVGDCCLFHVRDGQVISTFPMERSEEFDRHPMSICSVDRKHDELVASEFKVFHGLCRAGDLLVLATDAIAKWAMEILETDSSIDWSGFWETSQEEFASQVVELRNEKRMEIDDTSLLLLRVLGVAGVASDEPEQSGGEFVGSIDSESSENACPEADEIQCEVPTGEAESATGVAPDEAEPEIASCDGAAVDEQNTPSQEPGEIMPNDDVCSGSLPEGPSATESNMEDADAESELGLGDNGQSSDQSQALILDYTTEAETSNDADEASCEADGQRDLRHARSEDGSEA